MKKFLYAIATLVGMIIGAGIFGLPYVFYKSGMVLGFFYLIGLGVALFIVYLLYGEVILRTHKKMRLVGYADYYLGKKGKFLATFATLFGYYGTLLAYLILGGYFLNIIFRSFSSSEFFWSIIFFIFGALAIFFGLRTVSFCEFFMSGFLILVLIIIFWTGWQKIDINNLKNLSNFSYFFLPYGVILFSLAGSSAVPELRDILNYDEKKMRKAIFWGTLIPIVVCAVFVFLVVGVVGEHVSDRAIDSLAPFLGRNIIILGAVFGILAISTSFLVLGLNLRKVFQYDYGMKKIFAWILACFIPLVLFLILSFKGWIDFIKIIGIVGAIMGGIEGVLIILIYKKADFGGDRKPEYDIWVPNFILYILMAIFILGIIYEIIYLGGFS